MTYFVSLESTKLTGVERKLLKHCKVDGVILYGRNILSFKTTRKLIEDIKSVREDIKIAVDEEGGLVSRFSHLFSNYSQPYCSTLSRKKVRSHYRKRSSFLKEVGVDVNLAPVVDVAFNEESSLYKRSYGSDVEKIVDLAAICIDEQRKVGIDSCIKHFPGHGRTVSNSHVELPSIRIGFDEWKTTEMKIFEELIKFGVEYVMVGHLLFPRISDEIASLSRFWMKEILRKMLKFQGNIITDDICMKAFDKHTDKLKETFFLDVGVDSLIITEPDHPFLVNIAQE